MKGQAGIEYLVLFGVISFVLLIVAAFFYVNFQTQSRAYQARIAVDTLANAVDSVAAQGPGSNRLVNVYFPSGIISASTAGREVLIVVASADGRPNDVYAVAIANMSTNQLPLTEGNKQFSLVLNSNATVLISG